MTKTYYVIEMSNKNYECQPLIVGITSKLKKAAKLADRMIANASDDGVEITVTRYSCDNEIGYATHRCCLTSQDLRDVLARSA